VAWPLAQRGSWGWTVRQSKQNYNFNFTTLHFWTIESYCMSHIKLSVPCSENILIIKYDNLWMINAMGRFGKFFLHQWAKARRKSCLIPTYCFSMCEIDLPLSGRKNDKQLFAHGYPLYFLKHRLYTLPPCTSASQSCIRTMTQSDFILKIAY
jgi:hypothetical protein